jgi:hypothetical protein
MASPDQFGRYNRRRYVMLIVVIFIIVMSFFAGKWYGRQRRTYIQEPVPSGTTPPAKNGEDRAGVPPDSLPPQ